MKNKNGFTLIELLAVIVILAIIALIATPIILNIIDETKESSSVRSGELYIDAAEKSAILYQMEGNIVPDGLYTIMSNGNLCNGSINNNICNGTEIKVDVKNTIPSGTVILKDGNVVPSMGDDETILTINNDTLKYNNSGLLEIVENEVKTPCYLTKDNNSNNEIDTGDELACGTENFYVIMSDTETLTLFSKYNLNVGENANPSYTIGIQNENVIGGSGGYGYVYFVEGGYKYWTDDGTFPFVYGPQSNLYKYVDDYKTYLESNLNINVKDVSVLNREILAYFNCSDPIMSECNEYPDWLVSTSYWTGIADSRGHYDKDGIIVVDENSNFFSANSYSLNYGIRPIVVLDKSNL